MLYQKLVNSRFLFLFSLILFKAVFAADIVVDDRDVTKAPQLTQTDKGVLQINIVNPENGLSHNRFEQYNVGANGVVINNSRYGDVTDKLGFVGANKNLDQSAKTILFEVTGASRSELKGMSTIVGDQAKFILANPNGITCDGCGFINTHDVELRTDRLHSVVNGQANWEQDLSGDIRVGKGGVVVRDGALVLSSGKIKIEGGVSAKELLKAEAHFSNPTKDDEKYAIDVSTVSPIAAGKIYLVATGEGAGVKISAPNFLVNEGTEDINIEAQRGDVSIDAPLEIAGGVKFVGRDFKSQNVLKVGSIELDLSGDFINSENGNIAVKDGWRSSSKGFINYQKINVGKEFQVIGDHFINDKGGNVSAGSIEVKLTGKMADGNALNQGANSVLESREGGMKLIAPAGGMYFGYKKELTGAGDNKDGFKFVGSQLLSNNQGVYIQSGGDVVFDGTQLLGDVVVEAKGEIKENNLTGSYKDGVDNVKQTENKVRTVMKSSTETHKVYDHTDYWCKAFGIFDSCVGGWGHEDIYKDVSVTVEVPVQENYVQETTVQKDRFQDVTLKTNFSGDKRFFSNKADLIFKDAVDDKKEAIIKRHNDHLKFVASSDSVPVKRYEYRAEL